MNAKKTSSGAWSKRALLAIIIIGLGCTFYYFRERSSKTGKAKTFESTLLRVKHAIKKAGLLPPAEESLSPPILLVKRPGALYNSAIFIMVQQHPDLNLSRKDVNALQHIYSEYCLEKSEFESGIADIVNQPDGTRVVNIPPYPAQGKEMSADLIGEIEAYYNNQAPPDVIDVISTQFSAFDNDDGRDSRQLTIRAVYEPDIMPVSPNYTVIRNITMIDSAGKVWGTGSANDTVINIEQDGYAGQENFFPPPLSINRQTTN